jgi:hypothetical protein
VVQLRHYGGNRNTVHFAEIRTGTYKQTSHVSFERITVTLAVREQTPLRDQLLLAKESERDVCIARVNRQ